MPTSCQLTTILKESYDRLHQTFILRRFIWLQHKISPFPSNFQTFSWGCCHLSGTAKQAAPAFFLPYFTVPLDQEHTSCWLHLLPFNSALQGNRCISITHTYVTACHPGSTHRVQLIHSTVLPLAARHRGAGGKQESHLCFEGQRWIGYSSGQWNSSEARDWAEILRAHTDTSAKTENCHLCVPITHRQGRQTLVMWQLVSLLSLKQMISCQSMHWFQSKKTSRTVTLVKKAFPTTMWQHGAKKGEDKKAVLFESYFKFTSPGRTAFSLAMLSKKLQGQLLSFVFFFPKGQLGLHE